MNKTEEWLHRLQENGYRLTAPRRAVVETIAMSDRVLNPMEVFEQAKNRYSKLGLVTVYRTLDKLEELGLIQRVHRPSDCQAFIAASTGHQHLLICRICGRVKFFGGDESMGELMAQVGHKSGYEVEEHWLQMFGVCEVCQRST